MNIRSTKVVIIGAGNVGATCAYTIINEGLCDELCTDNKYLCALFLCHLSYLCNMRIACAVICEVVL